jgi:DNA-binding transcriptional regulator YdaS (Cro superfamily)
MEAKTALERAIEKAGSQALLAEQIGASQQLISYWLKKATRGVPAEFVGPIETATGIPRHELRPDLYDAPKASAA